MMNPWTYHAARRRVGNYLTMRFYDLLFAPKEILMGLPGKVQKFAASHPEFRPEWVCWATLSDKRFHVGSVEDYVREVGR